MSIFDDNIPDSDVMNAIKLSIQNDLQREVTDSLVEKLVEEFKQRITEEVRKEVTSYTFTRLETIKDVLSLTTDIRALIKYSDEPNVRTKP